MKRAISLAAIAAISCAQAFAAEPLAFEVASIKPAPAMTPAMMQSGQFHSRMDDGHVDISNISLMNLITMAYKVDQDYVSGPGWLADQNFSVTAKLPAGSNRSQIPAMLQQMLAERFKLAIHRTEKVQQVYLLTVGAQRVKAEGVERRRTWERMPGKTRQLPLHADDGVAGAKFDHESPNAGAHGASRDRRR